MKQSKKISLIFVCLFIITGAIIQTPIADVENQENTIVKEKIFTFLTDVINLDLSKYTIINDGYSESYPPEFDGLVKRENVMFTLKSDNSEIPVAAIIENERISWLHFYPSNGSMIFTKQPTRDALVESKNIFQRYEKFCQNYALNSSHVTSTIAMFSKIQNGAIDKTFSGNINNMSDFIPINVTSNNIKLQTSQTSIGAFYFVDGVEVRNKYLGISFGYDTFVFSDTWNLYKIGSLSLISEEEVTNIAWKTAENFSATLEYKTNNSSTILKPDWSKMRSDIGLVMIPGQIHNTAINEELEYINLGDTTREALSLYPLWQTLFYFSEPIGDIYGIQVGVWGDTKEIAYCDTFGFLGSIEPSSTNQTLKPFPFTEILLVTISATIAIAALIVIKRRK